jgi:carboxyl-terminal processing protease
MPERKKVLLPLLVFCALAAGYFIGRRHSEPYVYAQSDMEQGGAGARMEELIDYISREYVDTIDADSITTLAIEAVLARLDPHSQYIPASEFDFSKESIEGNFEGIGVEFQIFRDSIFVTSVIHGGPSEKSGLMPGDRIVAVDGKTLVKTDLRNEFVLRSLRGKSGSCARLSLFNPHHTPTLRTAEVVRGKIPYRSVHYAMLPSQTGYLNIDHFSIETGKEVKEALEQLKLQQMKALVVDVRGNPGGVLQSAVEVCDEFIGDDKIITYTMGKARQREEFHAGKTGAYEKGPLAILIDENSASAAEIVAGAIQDHNRGILIGRRSFGKGFVQEQSRFSDGSGMRLTIARYYTPSGRCIQKPYSPDQLNNYHEEAWDRLKTGELFHQDSIHTAGLPEFRTSAGKRVFGGGGIIPDIFVPLDTMGYGKLAEQLTTEGLLNELAYDKAESMRVFNKKEKPTARVLLNTLQKQSDKALWQELCSSVKMRKKMVLIKAGEAEKKHLINQFRALTARYVAKEEGHYQVSVLNDKCFKTAAENLLQSVK